MKTPTVFFCMLFSLKLFAGTAEVMPARTGLGALLYAPFQYRKAWDADRNSHPIGYDAIRDVNALLGAELVGGRYEADYDTFLFEILAGITDSTTLHVQLPWFQSEVRQRVDVFAPPPMEGMIRQQLDGMGFRSETLKGDGFGDLHFWVLHQYLRHPRFGNYTLGLGWRTPVLARNFDENTEKLNVSTREAETALLNHNVDLPLSERLLLNYRLEYQHPFEGDRDVFAPGVGPVNLTWTPGWQLTHELELKSYWIDSRVSASFGLWYRDEGADTLDGIKGNSKTTSG